MEQDQDFSGKFCELPQKLMISKDTNQQLSWRMSGTLFEEETGFGLHPSCMDWPSSGMMRNGTFYQLPTLVHAIGGSEYGLLPTPARSNKNGTSKDRFFRSKKYKGNLDEALRDGPEDQRYPHPERLEEMMGFPIGHTELL